MAVKGRVAVSGAAGFIGARVCEALRASGYEVAPLVRRETSDPDAIFYDYEARRIDVEKLARCCAVIHLAGKNVMSGLWTSAFKQELYDSRVKSTRFIAHHLAKIDGPRILLNASACGIYGDRADQKLDETASAGKGFLAKLCVDWERGTLFAKEAGLRVVKMRLGIALDKDGGMLKPLLPFFKRGLGGILGSGEQYFSYVTRDMLVKQILFLLENSNIHGPVNCVAYEPTTQAQFATALARVYGHDVRVKIPTFLLKALGEQASMMVTSLRVYPKVLIDNHFPFEHHKPIEETLRAVLV